MITSTIQLNMSGFNYINVTLYIEYTSWKAAGQSGVTTGNIKALVIVLYMILTSIGFDGYTSLLFRLLKYKASHIIQLHS